MKKIIITFLIMFFVGFIGLKIYQYFPSTLSESHFINQTYTTTLPCADCDGIQTTLTLQPNHSFNRASLYLGKNKKFEESGTWQWNPQRAILTLTNRDQNSFFYVTHKNLTLLDQNGNEITGPLKSFYVFKQIKK